MREIIEFRVPEERAGGVLGPREGRILGGMTRVVQADARDELARRIIEHDRARRASGGAFYHGWKIRRDYTKEEFKAAELFHLIIERFFEQPPEPYERRYDDATGCRVCRAEAAQVDDLAVDVARIPKMDISATLAREVVISTRLRDLLAENDVTGFKTRPVRSASGKQLPSWHQLIVIGEFLEMVSPTRAGDDPSETAEESTVGHRMSPPLLPPLEQGLRSDSPVLTHPLIRQAAEETRAKEVVWCPNGHLVGRNLLSELYLRRTDYRGSDLSQTKQHVGVRLNLFRPERPLLASPRLRKLLLKAQVTGVSFEVAHLV